MLDCRLTAPRLTPDQHLCQGARGEGSWVRVACWRPRWPFRACACGETSLGGAPPGLARTQGAPPQWGPYWKACAYAHAADEASHESYMPCYG